MTPLQFVDKWRPVTLTERAAAQEHYIDLCRLFDHPTPVEDDPTGERFTFEKGVQRAGGGDGFADVWKRGHFAWEYKKRKRNLDEALGQLSRYALALESPPLHVVCDTDRFRIVTAYTNCVPKSYELSLEDVLDNRKRAWLESAFYNPTKLKPGASRADLTRSAASKFSSLTERLQAKNYSIEEVGHFINRLVFLFFAEDVGILEDNLFRKAILQVERRPIQARSLLTDLFRAFKTGGRFGLDHLPWINGGLFDDKEALDLDEHDIGLIKAASSQDWAHIDPTIFGTLFERFLDPAKRSQIGAHYTDAVKISKIISPVIVEPLEEEWTAARSVIAATVAQARRSGVNSRLWQRAEEHRSRFMERLRNLAILDPACGSGNFLYLSLRAIKDLEHKANQECEALGLPPRLPAVGPAILWGIEINPLAAELAKTTIWIGDIQWSIENGIKTRPEPLLQELRNIVRQDALLTQDGLRVEWPKADYIVGNPPFLGGKLLRRRLEHEYVDSLFRAYKGKVAPESDLVAYWCEQARQQIVDGRCMRAGLIATNSIRDKNTRRALQRIASDTDLFDVWSDEAWVVEGAAVRVSIICFRPIGLEQGSKRLNGGAVETIHSNLSSRVFDITKARILFENKGVSFQGVTKGGPFEVDRSLALEWLRAPLNANDKPNAEVLRPIFSGGDIVKAREPGWVVDFTNLDVNEAAFFEAPFEYVRMNVKPLRDSNKRSVYRDKWWLFSEQRQGMRKQLAPISRYIATPKVSKHRLFVWMNKAELADNLVVVIARDDDTTFGILSSSFHRHWSLELGSTLEDRPTYTPTTAFETFPFPPGLGPDTRPCDFASDSRAERIALAARKLSTARQAWLFPADLIRIEPEVVPGFPNRIVPKDTRASVVLAQRSLTRLYNDRPTWLVNAETELDRAVAAAYGWSENVDITSALERLLLMNLSMTGATRRL